MKKLKFFVLSFIVWILLFGSLSFSYFDNYTYVDWVFSSSSWNSVVDANYLYTYKWGSYYWSRTNAFALWFSKYYDWTYHTKIYPNCAWRWSTSSLVFQNILFNHSYSSIDLANGSRVQAWSEWYCDWNSSFNADINIFLWHTTNIWQNFVALWNLNEWGVKFAMWNSLNTNWINNYVKVSPSDSNYVRIIFDPITFGYSNPWDNLSPNTFSWLDNFSWTFHREYFYNKWTRTDLGYIVDDWSKYTKFKHFWLSRLWYSYTYSKFWTSYTWINRNSLWFRTVSSAASEIYLLVNWSIPYDEFNSYNDPNNTWINLEISFNGILSMPSSSYYSIWNSNWLYLFSKDPYNLKQVLYEHRSCTDINWILNNSSSCVKLDWGYLTYNWTSSVLPFENKNTLYDITSLNSSYPLLYDLLGSSTDSHWYNVLWNSCMYINNSTRCYGFESNSNVDIIELYLDSIISNQPTPGWNPLEQQQALNELCAIPSWYALNPWVCNAFYGSTMYNWTNVVWSWNLAYTPVENCVREPVSSGSDLRIKRCYSALVPVTYNQDTYIDDDWNVWYYSSWQLFTDYLTDTWSLNFLTWRVDSWGLISWEYFHHFWDIDFNDESYLFSCPYPLLNKFWKITEISLGSFHPFMPIECWYSAWSHWKSVDYFSQFWVFPDMDSHLIEGDSYLHNTLFAFFDVLLTIWLLVFIRLFLSLFNWKK